jgi:SAM-dependent methyltransferase
MGIPTLGNPHIKGKLSEHPINGLNPLSELHFLLKPDAAIDWSGSIPADTNMKVSEGIDAHNRYFSNRKWMKGYFDHVHRDDAFKDRWTTALGSVEDKVVVEIGCGPGNVFSMLGTRPRVLVGVDVAEGALEQARATGYQPLLADAHDLPLRSGIADIVILNATLHHCEDMATVLKEAARLVAPGGLLVTDHDPQLSAWNFKGPGLLLWKMRLMVYNWMGIGCHSTLEEQATVLASELHHRPGDGVTRDLFENVLGSLGFDVEIFPHNHNLGHEVLKHQRGRSELKFQVGQILSGINPNAPEAALSLMCRARLPLSQRT